MASTTDQRSVAVRLLLSFIGLILGSPFSLLGFVEEVQPTATP